MSSGDTPTPRPDSSSGSGMSQRARALPRTRPIFHLLLFAATVCAVYASSRPFNPFAVFLQDTPVDSLVFCLAVMSILLAHELGHYLAGVVHRIELTLPYFIPVPFAFGTMGAVIRMKRIALRRELLDVGVAGPLAGMALAVPYALAGVMLSPVRPVPVDMPTIQLGDCLLMRAFAWWLHGPIPEGSDLFLHPIGLAAWFGFLITSLNLMPAGQLDGGHIVKALSIRGHWVVTRVVFLALTVWGALGDAILIDPRLFVTGAAYAGVCVWWMLRNRQSRHARKILFALFVAHVTVSSMLAVEGLSMPWMIWSLMLFAFRLDHPPVDDETVPLSTARRAAGWLAMAVFVLTFVPVPIRLIIPPM